MELKVFGKKNRKDDPESRKQEILAALSQVTVSGHSRNIVEMAAIRNLTISDDQVGFSLAVADTTAPERDRLQTEARQAVESLGWPGHVSVSVTSETSDSPTPELNQGSRIRNIIAVASGKGGVGKSTVAANLAFALAREGAKVGIMDADIYGPSIPHMLGLTGQRPTTTTSDGKQRLLPITHEGIKVISMGFLVEAEKPVIWRGPMVHGAVQQFFRDVVWGELDHLVIDLPPGTGDVQLTMVQEVPITGAVVVSTPQDVAMIDARKAYNMFGDTNVPVLGIIENMSTFSCPSCGTESHIFGKDGARNWAGEKGTRFLGAIPIDIGIRTAGDAGTPAVAAETTADHVVSAFNDIARAVVEELDKRTGQTPGKLELQL